MIRLEGITRCFAGREGRVAALDGVDPLSAKGEIFGFIGSSGAEKSTLLRLVNPLHRPTGGDVSVAREAATHAKGAGPRTLARFWRAAHTHTLHDPCTGNSTRLASLI